MFFAHHLYLSPCVGWQRTFECICTRKCARLPFNFNIPTAFGIAYAHTIQIVCSGHAMNDIANIPKVRSLNNNIVRKAGQRLAFIEREHSASCFRLLARFALTPTALKLERKFILPVGCQRACRRDNESQHKKSGRVNYATEHNLPLCSGCNADNCVAFQFFGRI